jgi:hypothetical protein
VVFKPPPPTGSQLQGPRYDVQGEQQNIRAIAEFLRPRHFPKNKSGRCLQSGVCMCVSYRIRPIMLPFLLILLVGVNCGKDATFPEFKSDSPAAQPQKGTIKYVSVAMGPKDRSAKAAV